MIFWLVIAGVMALGTAIGLAVLWRTFKKQNPYI
jgi:NADH:ubiquinone oxidoreductase subunit K